jgi:hypothetical protein
MENTSDPRAIHSGPKGTERSRLPHFLHNRLIHSGEIVRLTRQPPFTPRKIPGTYELEAVRGSVDARATGQLKHQMRSWGNRTRDLPAC